MEEIQFRERRSDPRVFIHSEGTEVSIVAVYVYDLIIITKPTEGDQREHGCKVQDERSWKTSLLPWDHSST